MVVSVLIKGDLGLYRKELLFNSDLLALFDKSICKDMFIKVRATELKINSKDRIINYELI